VRTPEQIQAYNDSIAAMRTYMKSKAYNDSIDRVRKARMDSIRAYQDSLKAENARYKDSMQKAFEEKKLQQQWSIDSLKNERQKVIDSLNEVKKYKSSKAYKDSVDAIRQRTLDSMKSVRQLYMDSVKAEQKRQLDSLKEVQRLRNDSLKASIQARNDSMKLYIDSMKQAQLNFKDSMEKVKQNRLDSLAQLKDKRLDEMYERDKQREKEKRDREREKVEKARANYTNDELLKKGWGWRRKATQNTFTRYNYFYNATNKIREAENNMYVARIDNFDSLISLYPYDPKTSAAMFTNDMDSLSKRLAVGIQIHDPRSKWQDDLFLLLGKAYYYKGDFENAAQVFEYVMNYDKKYDIRKKDKNDKNKKKEEGVLGLDKDKKGLAGVFQHKLAKNDAVIWLAQTLIQQKEFEKAEILLDMIRLEPNLDSKVLANVYESYAHLYLEKNQPQSALPYLDSIAFNANIDKRLRQRASYLGAQLYAETSDWENAERLYANVAHLNAPIEMDLNAQLNKTMVQAYQTESNFPQIVKQLNKMAKEDKYRQYKDKIYLSLGQTYVKKGDMDEAIDAFNKSIENAQPNSVNKGLAYYELGQMYFENKKYILAKSSFDSAAVFLRGSNKNQLLAQSQKMATNLTAIAVPAAKIELIDSILNLTRLNDKEQMQWARKELKKYQQSLSTSLASTGVPSTGAPGGGRGSFYFSSPEQIEKGKAEFKSTWGERPLVDNWRRASDIRFVSPDNNTTSSDDLPFQSIDEQYFLSKIPKSPAVIDSLSQELEKSYVDLEKTFIITEDYSSVKSLYKDFSIKYPQSAHLETFYYDLYMIYFSEGQKDSATYFHNLLSSRFQNSVHLQTIADMKNTPASTNTDYSGIESHMEQTYRLLQAQMFKDVIVRTEEVKKEYPVQFNRYQSHYNLMKGIAYAGLNDISMADSILQQVVTQAPSDSLKYMAQDVLNYLKKGVSDNVVDTVTSDPSSISFLDPNLMSTQYVNNKSEKHYVILYVEKADNRMMPLRAGIMDFNIMNKSDLNLKASFSELKNNERLIVIKEFKNDAQAKKYISDLKQQKELFKDYKINLDIKVVSISESNFKLLMSKKDFLGYLNFYNKNY